MPDRFRSIVRGDRMPVDPAEQIRLGRSLVTVSKLSLGGGPFGRALDPDREGTVEAIVQRAWEIGVRHFDTAPLYGLGLSERRVGRALSSFKPEDRVIATKVGRLLRPPSGPDTQPVFDYSFDGVMKSLDESLARMRVVKVDILHLHDPDDHWDEASGDGYMALDVLRTSGVVKAIGAGMNQSEMLSRFARETHLDCFLVAGRYTLLDQSALAELMPLCSERDIGVIIGGVYNSGILAGPVEGAHFNYRPASAEWLAKAQRLEAICARHETPLKAAAIQFPFAHPAVATVLSGVRSVAELDENARMMAYDVPADLWRAIRTDGLVPENCPLPGGH